jgi:NAD(P)-dependent dehydrogenase (short-subunit alcohol dehydrogenase family)
MATIILCGANGAMGKMLFDHFDASGRYRGRPVAHLVAVDYFRDDEARASFREAATTKHFAAAGRLTVLHWDAASLASTKALVAQIDESMPSSGDNRPGIDAVILASGLGFHGSTLTTTLDENHKAMTRLLNVNAVGPAMLCQWCAQRMVRDAETDLGEPPLILVMSSFSAVIGLPFRAAYCSSKFALNGFLEALHADVNTGVTKRRGIRIVSVCPTSVSTNFRANAQKEFAAGATKSGDGPALNKADMTPDECIAAILATFDHKKVPVPQRAGLQVLIMPQKPWYRFQTAEMAQFLARAPFGIDRWARAKFLNKLAKL